MNIVKGSYAKGLLYEQIILNLCTEEVKRENYEKNNYNVKCIEDYDYVISNTCNSYHFGIIFNAKTFSENRHYLRKNFNELDEDSIRYILTSSIYTLLLDNKDEVRLAEFTHEDFKYIDNYIDRQMKWYLNSIRFKETVYPTEDEVVIDTEKVKVYVKDRRLFVNYKEDTFEIPNSIYEIFKNRQGFLKVFLRNVIIYESYKKYNLV